MRPQTPWTMLRKRETIWDRLHRFRGVLLIATVPALLLLILYICLPRGFTEATESNVPVGGHRYSVVFDAGSTGSRVHVFKFAETGGSLELVSDTFEQLKPGLGDKGWADDPERAAASLKPLLDVALRAVPAAEQASTPIELRATAGLRLLPGHQADDILAAVSTLLHGSPFRLVPDGVSIMDGVDEGAYAWMTLNYLLGLIGQPEDRVVAAIDMGGGSIQQAFAVDAATAARAPEGYIRRMSGGGQSYDVYVYSYLGYGLMQGRGALLGVDGSEFCLNKGTNGVYKSPYGGQEFQLRATEDGGDFGKCAQAARDAMRVGAACGSVPATECSFDGVWGGAAKHDKRKFFVSSYFFDRALDAGIIKDGKATSFATSPAAFKDAAHKACSTPLDKLGSAFPAADSAVLQYLCIDLTFQYAMLATGLKVPDGSAITLVKQVEYHGELFEAAWPLGAAVNTLSSS